MRGDKLAKIWKRIFAYAVDIFVVNSIIIRPLNQLLDASIPKDMQSLMMFVKDSNLKAIFLITLVSGMITILYWAILEYKIQQTLGGFLLDIKVKSEIRKTKFSQFLFRNVTKISPIILLLDSISVLYSNKRQRFTERLSKTKTIENEK